MKKSNKSKKTLTIFALAVITLAFFAACVNPFFPKLKEKDSDGNRRTDDTLAVTIAAAFEPDGKQVTITATVTGDGGGNLSYQWYSNTVYSSEDGTELPDETETTYRPTTTSPGTTYYYVEVTNTLSGKTSSAVSNILGVVVHEDGEVEIIGSEIETPVVTIAYTPLDGGNVTLTASASVSDGGTLSYQWYANTGDSSAGGTELYGETGTTYTPPVATNGTTYYYVKATNTLRGQTASAVSNTVKIVVQNNEIVIEEIVVSDTIETPVVTITAESGGGNVTLTAAASVSDGGEISYQWYKNTVDSGRGGTPIADAKGTSYTPTVGADGTAYYYVKATNTLKGQTASAVSNTVKIVVEDSEIIEVIVSDTVVTPVVTITASVNGRNVILTAEASAGAGAALSYQWYRNTVENSKNGSLIAGATGTTYAPPTASPGTTYYYVKVTNTLDGQTAGAVSNVIGILVPEEEGPVTIVGASVETPTVSISAVVENKNVTITAAGSVSDGGTLSYQWYRNTQNNTNGTPVPNATGETYQPPTSSPGTTYYYVRATNTLDGKTASAFSNILGVAVPAGGGAIEIFHIETPTVTITAGVVGSTVTLTAVASVSEGMLSYQWYSNSQNNKTGTLISGATGETYKPPTSSPGKTYYYVEATNTLDGHTASAFSNIIGVVVPSGGGGTIEILHVETPTVSISAAVNGSTVTLTADARIGDEGILSYQWYSNTHNSSANGTIIQNATGITYQPTTTSAGTKYYYVIATNALNGRTASATSNILGVVIPTGGGTGGGTIVVVEAEMPSISAAASPAGPYRISATVTLTASVGSVSDGGTLSYQWYSNTHNNKNGTMVPGETKLTYTPTTSSLGTKYYYCVATNTLNGKSASAESNVVEIEVKVTEIHSATVTVTTPVISATPHVQASTNETDYTVGEVAWSSGGTAHTGAFLGNTAYTATVTLTAQEGYAFASSFAATINGTAATVSNKTNGSVTISLAFDKTLAKVVADGGVTITAPATKMTYTHGEALDLNGLTIKVTYNDSTYDEGTLAVLSAHDRLGTNISAAPANGEQLSRAVHHGEPVVITAGGETANTGNLTVNQKGLTAVAVSHTKPYDGTAAATGITVSSFNGKEFNDDVAIASATGVYTNANAGTKTLNITGGTLTGADSDNYTVAAVNGLTVTGGITKANPTVTWPTGFTAGYGTTLSNISLASTNGAGAGTFTWTTPSTLVGAQGTQSHSMTFTPTDTTNYNTLTQNVNITVNKANPTVTWPTYLIGRLEQTLADVSLPGNGTTTAIGGGTFAWVDPTTPIGDSFDDLIGNGNSQKPYEMRFTPNDTVNYNTLTQVVWVTIVGADAVVTWPSGEFTATYGQTLADIPIPNNGQTKIAGTFRWSTPSTSVGVVGTRSFNMSFAPDPTENPFYEDTWEGYYLHYYSGSVTSVPVTVNPKEVTVMVGTPSNTITPFDTTATFTVTVSGLVGNDTATVSSSTSGFALSNNTGLTNNVPKTVTMTYSGGFSSNDLGSRIVSLVSSNTNYTPGSATVSVTVNRKAVTVTVGPVSNTLSPIDTTATFTVTVAGLVGSDTLTVSMQSTPALSTYGLTLSGDTLTNIGNGTRTLTLTYNGATAVTSVPLSLSLSISVNNNYTLSGSPTVTPTVYDGGAADRAIPVTPENIGRFNTHANTTNGRSKHYKLMADVTAPTTWTPIGTSAAPFTGSFDGQGHTITGLQDAMFDTLASPGIIKDLKLNVNINTSSTSSMTVGGIVKSMSGGTVQDCSVTGSVSGTSSGTGSVTIGSVVGYMTGGTVQDSHSTANVSGTTTTSTATSYVGGVVGSMSNNGMVKNCSSGGSVTFSGSNTRVGGVVGMAASNSMVQNCSVTDSVSVTNTATTDNGSVTIGGVVGMANNSTVQNCSVTDSVSVTNTAATTSGSRMDVGGVVGNMTGGTVQSCFVTGSVSGAKPSGFVGNSSVPNTIGGVVGYVSNGGTVQDCYSTASVSGTASTGRASDVSVGGVVGLSSGSTVQNCYATGDVSGDSPAIPEVQAASIVYVGGVVGHGSGTITKCVALNSSLKAFAYDDGGSVFGQVGRVGWGDAATYSYNYGRSAGMTMTTTFYADSTSVTVTPTSSLTGKDGADTSSWNTSGFWTTASNWGGTAWDFTNVWEWNTSLSRPILRGFAAGAQGE